MSTKDVSGETTPPPSGWQQPKRSGGRTLLIGVLLVLLVVIGLTNLGRVSRESRPDPTPVGAPAAYDRINRMTDCEDLQGEFDQAAANFDAAPKGTSQSQAAIDFMKAADERMKTVGCY